MDHAEDSIVVLGTGRGTRSKRRRLGSPSRNQSPTATAPAVSNSSTLPYNAQSPCRPEESVDTALRNLKAWIKAGAPHDKVCFTCGKPGDIVGCVTCRLSFHESCKPTEGRYSAVTGAWYCHICVRRNWHVEPPSLTPPASPTQSAAELRVDPRRPASPPPQRTGSPGLPRRSRSPPPPPRRSTNVTEPSRELDRAKHPRKSRYSTLPTDVDNALRVLYAELESSGDLRQQVGHLTAEMTRLRQELDLGKKELELARKVSESVRVSQQELSQLRLEAAQRKAAVDEVATLKREKQQMEAELKDSQAQLEKMKKTLQDWKRSLSSLVEE